MNQTRYPGIAIFLALAPASVLADVALEQTMKIEARGLISVFETQETLRTQVSGQRMRTERFSGDAEGTLEEASIINLRNGVAWLLNPSQQSYETRSLAELRADAERDIALIEEMPVSGPDALPISEQTCQWGPPRIEIDRTGEKTRIAGVKAEQHLATVASTCKIEDTRQACDVTWVLDYWNARRMPGDRELSDFRRGLADHYGTAELMALIPVIPQGLLALFEEGWEEAMYEADGLKGFPVKTVMSLHIGGDDCRTRSDREITRDTVWSNVKKDSIQATKNSAAATAGNVVAGSVLQKIGGSFGGMIASSAAGILTRDAASKAMNKEDEGPGPVSVGPENLAERIDGQVEIFRITTELQSVSEAKLPNSLFEAPRDWQEIQPGS